jgi:hypothetical protein
MDQLANTMRFSHIIISVSGRECLIVSQKLIRRLLQVLLQALSKPDGSQSTKSYKVKSQAELDALLKDETFNKRETIQLIELIMPRDDAPRALKTQAQLVGDLVLLTL